VELLNIQISIKDYSTGMLASRLVGKYFVFKVVARILKGSSRWYSVTVLKMIGV